MHELRDVQDVQFIGQGVQDPAPENVPIAHGTHCAEEDNTYPKAHPVHMLNEKQELQFSEQSKQELAL